MLRAVLVQKIGIVVNAIVKLSGVSSEGLSKLMQVLVGEGNKLNGTKGPVFLTQDTSRYQDGIPIDQFRLIKVQEVKPEGEGDTYLVVIKVCFEVWDCEGLFKTNLGLETFLGMFRAVKPGCLPLPDNSKKLRMINELLLNLVGEVLPFELHEDETGSAGVCVQRGFKIEIMTILTIIPRLRYLKCDHRMGSDRQADRLAKCIADARAIAETMI